VARHVSCLFWAGYRGFASTPHILPPQSLFNLKMDKNKWKKLEFLLDIELQQGTDEDIGTLVYELVNAIIDNANVSSFALIGILEVSKARIIDEIIQEYRDFKTEKKGGKP